VPTLLVELITLYSVPKGSDLLRENLTLGLPELSVPRTEPELRR
jgi:hypothetical protein